MTKYFDVLLEFPEHNSRPEKWKTQGTKGIRAETKRVKETCEHFYGPAFGRLKVKLTPTGGNNVAHSA